MAFLLVNQSKSEYNNNRVYGTVNACPANVKLSSREMAVSEAPKFSFQKPLRVLVIEDNQVDRKMLESMLTEAPNSASFLKSTDRLDSAIKLLKEYEFDAVLLDLNLPDSKGEQTIIKVNEIFPEIAIVVSTGAYEDDLGLKTLSLGAQDFLIKGKYNAYVLNKVLHYSIERKRLELALKNTSQKLDSTESQLIQAEKMKVVGSLASGVAHEVKNPLATILYGVTYLNEHVKFDDEKIDAVLENLKEATNRANDIITDMLDFASLKKLNKEKCDINDVIDKALSLVKHHCDKFHVKVLKHVDQNLPQIEIDQNRIEQVLVNIILNSIFAMKEGGDVTIAVRQKKVSKDLSELPHPSRNGFKPGDKILVLTIEDSGSGIPEDKLGQIFEPFFTTRRGTGGVGLGLSVSQNIMDIHEGDIDIENRSEGGARATLIFKA